MGLGEVQHEILLGRESLPAAFAIMSFRLGAHASTSLSLRTDRVGASRIGPLLLDPTVCLPDDQR